MGCINMKNRLALLICFVMALAMVIGSVNVMAVDPPGKTAVKTLSSEVDFSGAAFYGWVTNDGNKLVIVNDTSSYSKQYLEVRNSDDLSMVWQYSAGDHEDIIVGYNLDASVVVASEEGYMQIFDANGARMTVSGRDTSTMSIDSNDPVAHVSVADDGKVFAGYGSGIILVDTDMETELLNINPLKTGNDHDTILQVEITPSGSHYGAYIYNKPGGVYEATFYLFEADNDVPIVEMEVDHLAGLNMPLNYEGNRFHIAPDGSTFVMLEDPGAGVVEPKLNVYTVADFTTPTTNPAPSKTLNGVPGQFNQYSKFITFGSSSSLAVYDIQAKTFDRQLTTSNFPAQSEWNLKISNDGASFVKGIDNDPIFYYTNTGGNEPVWTNDTDYNNFLSMSGDGLTVVANAGKTLYLFQGADASAAPGGEEDPVTTPGDGEGDPDPTPGDGGDGEGTEPLEPQAPDAPTTPVTLRNEGTTTQVKLNEAVSFSHGEETHYIVVKGVTATTATVEVWSTPQTVTVDVGETQEVDTDGNGLVDLSVTLDATNVTAGTADFTIKAIEEVADEFSILGMDMMTLMMVIGGVVVLLVVIVAVAKKGGSKPAKNTPETEAPTPEPEVPIDQPDVEMAPEPFEEPPAPPAPPME